MKIVTVIGARPQFIKAAAVSRVVRDISGIQELLVHTGQHFDRNMSDVFFDELNIPAPAYNLGIGGGRHGAMTGHQMTAIEEVLIKEFPACVLVYGDTNSTLAGALAAAKLHIPVAHVEAGLRSFNRRMPEEINRVVTDHISDSLFAPTELATQNLYHEGITANVFNVGDVMLDASLYYRAKASRGILERLGLNEVGYVLATCHRAENTDDSARLAAIMTGLRNIAKKLPVVMPVHPRTVKMLEAMGMASVHDNLHMIEPVSFLEMITLEASAKFIATDSGGVQKEAYFFGVPCVTFRDETEWVETLASGWNKLVGADAEKIYDAIDTYIVPSEKEALYGEGNAAELIVDQLLNKYGR